ncbi:MAG: glycosyltransferase family 4 protein [Flavobacteriaceae bacterium]|nr:glycosyltransferase family 4 protein [Flavobacteriaceae bacterium]
MNSNKLLLITSEFPPQPGGIGNHALNLADSLQKEGMNITVLTNLRSENGVPEAKFDGDLKFEVKRVKRRKVIWISYFTRFIKAMQLIRNADTVLASGKFSLWLVFFLKLFYKKKYVAIIHGSELMLSNTFLKKFTNKCLTKFESIVAVSNYTKSLISDLNLENIKVIPNGFSILKRDARDEIHQKPEQLNLITVGNVTQRKGQHNVINAIPELLKSYPNLKYNIVGIPTEKDKIKILVNDLGVEKNVEFYGKVSEEKKCDLLANSSIFFMLSEQTTNGDIEGFGIAILEANAFGVPAIGSKDCGIEDAIDHQETGCLVHPTDIASIVKAVNVINESYSDYSRKANLWSKDFSWDKIVLKYLEIIKK